MNTPMKLNILSMICLLTTIQCTDQSKGDSAGVASGDVIGTWRNLSMNITYREKDSVFAVPEGQWEEILRIKPIVTTYSSDYKYLSQYYSLEDSLLFSTQGTWELLADTLFLTTNGATTGYHFSLDGNVGEFNGILDWDEDGQANEQYTGRQVKSGPQLNAEKSRQLIGKWRSESLRVIQETYKGGESRYVLEVNPDNYIETTGLETALVEFFENGRYIEDYIGPDGIKTYSQTGYWFMVEDSLVLAISKPLRSQAVQRYFPSFKSGKGIFTSLMDYDGDGEEDDRFKGVSVKISE